MEIIEMIADERRGVADLVEGLTPEQLATPSLCAGWTVKDVAAHLAMPLDTGLATFAAAMITSRGDFDKANLKLTARHARGSAGDIAATLRRNADKPFKPPGMGLTAPLSDLLIHGQDIRRPLGLAREFPPERILTVLRFLQDSPRGFGTRSRLDGLALEATDADWSYGSGAVVRGPAEALMLVMAGRPVALPELEGDGVGPLTARLG